MKKFASISAGLLLFGSAFAAGEVAETAAKESVFSVGFAPILIVVVIALIIAFIVVGNMKAQLKTARHKTEASDYVRPGSFNLSVKQDYFLYRNVERRRIENTNNKK